MKNVELGELSILCYLGGFVLDFMGLNLPCVFFFSNQHTTQATPNPDVDDNCKMFKKLSRYDFRLKNVELGEPNILRYPKPSYEHGHPPHTCTYRYVIDMP